MTRQPAIAMLELDSVAVGTRAADAMVKRAPIDLFRFGTVETGKFLILVGGSVAAVEEAYFEGVRYADSVLIDEILLPDVHDQVFDSVTGNVRRGSDGDALGVIETSTMASNVRAADRAIKAADVNIVEIRLGDGIGGRGLMHVTGKVEDVEVAIEAGTGSVASPVIVAQSVVIPMQDGEVRDRLAVGTRFFGDG